jgi:hypothetical protein
MKRSRELGGAENIRHALYVVCHHGDADFDLFAPLNRRSMKQPPVPDAAQPLLAPPYRSGIDTCLSFSICFSAANALSRLET